MCCCPVAKGGREANKRLRAFQQNSEMTQPMTLPSGYNPYGAQLLRTALTCVEQAILSRGRGS